VLGLDCCEAFLEIGRRNAEAEGIVMDSNSWVVTARNPA
jgi:hypothetical protein